MSGTSAIEWTDATWNPVTGCDRVSPGCAHCYALDLAARLKGMGQPRYQRDGDPKTSGPGFGVTLHPDKLDEPLRWRKPRRVFVNSMSDLFHEEIPDDYIARVFAVMGAASQHTYQVLTKRPERMHDYLNGPNFALDVYAAADEMGVDLPWGPLMESDLAVFPNVWRLGVSIENRRFVHRAELLRQTPAAVRFISAEPLLGPLAPERMFCSTCSMEGPDDHCEECEGIGNWWLDGGLRLDEIDWLIVGGESGAQHRPMKRAWAEDLRDLAADYETAFFFKQWGGRTPKSGGRELDGRTWDEMPT